MNFFKNLLALILAESIEDIQANATKRIDRAIDAHQRKSEKAFEKVRKLEAKKQAADEQVSKGQIYKRNIEKMFNE